MARSHASRLTARIRAEGRPDSDPYPNRFQVWLAAHREPVRVGLAAAAVAFFFTHGLPLWNDDYSQWLEQANRGFLNLLGRLLLPTTIEPQTWGYSDRPVQVLLYKILHLVFGTWGTGFFFVKSVAFGSLCGSLYHFMRRFGIERHPAYFSLALFVFSTNTIASLVWHSDFGIYAQLAGLFALMYAFDFIEKGPSTLAIYRKGWSGIPMSFLRFTGIFAAAVYFGAKIRGDVRLVPLILLAYLAIYRREKAKVYAPPLALAFAATFPYSGDFFKHLPPFFPGAAGYQGVTFGGFSVSRLFEFLFGDFLAIRTASLSILGAVGLFFTLGAAVYLGFRIYREQVTPPGSKMGFFWVWLGVALLGCATLAKQEHAFQLRYTLIPLVPATFICASVIQAAAREFGRKEWFRPVFLALFAAQMGLHLFHDYQHRRDMGATQVSVDRMYSAVETDFSGAQLVMLPGFLAYGYKASNSTAIAGRKTLGTAEEITAYPAGSTVAASWNATLDARYVLDRKVSACGYSLFDLVFCPRDRGAFLLRFSGGVPAIAEADAKDKAGDLTGGRDQIEGYLANEPGNHGAHFIAGLYNYRLRDFARMEKNYETLGPFFMDNPAVVYNWALSKQGLEKFKDAARLLEHVYRQVPKDYAVGFNLADSYYRTGRKGRALATLSELMQAYPNDATMKSVYTEWSKP